MEIWKKMWVGVFFLNTVYYYKDSLESCSYKPSKLVHFCSRVKITHKHRYSTWLNTIRFMHGWNWLMLFLCCSKFVTYVLYGASDRSWNHSAQQTSAEQHQEVQRKRAVEGCETNNRAWAWTRGWPQHYGNHAQPALRCCVHWRQLRASVAEGQCRRSPTLWAMR